MKKLFQFIGAAVCGLALIVLLAGLYIWFTFEHVETGDDTIGYEQGAENVVHLTKNIASFDRDKIAKSLEPGAAPEMVSEFLGVEESTGAYRSIGEPVMLKKIIESGRVHYHFIVPVQFENEVGSFWVHMVHENGESKISTFKYN